MKKDFEAIFQEPAREGSSDSNRDCKRARRYKDIKDLDALDALPKRQAMKPRDDWDGRKRSVELYGPIKKFLHSRVGKPWDKVYSEFCSKTRSRDVAYYNARRLLKYYVEFNVREDAGDVYRIGTPRWRAGRPLINDGQTFYVDSHGILRVPKRRKLPKGFGWTTSNQPKLIEYCPDGPDGEKWQKHEGIWYRIAYEHRRGSLWDPGGPDKQLRPVQKQLSKKDLRRIPQDIRDS